MRSNAGRGKRRPPQQERSRATKSAILGAARRILTEEGIAALTPTHITKIAGVSPGSLYQYFGGIEEICAALLEETCSEYYAALCAALDAVKTLPIDHSLPQLIERMVAEMCRAPLLHSGVISPLSPKNRLVYLEYVDKHVAAIEAFFSTLGSAIGRPPDLAAFVLVHAAEGVGQALARVPPGDAQIARLTHELVELVLAYLRPPLKN